LFIILVYLPLALLSLQELALKSLQLRVCQWKLTHQFLKNQEEQQEQQLPNPFPLPQNYSVDVEVDLKRGSMTVTSMRKFLTAVAHAIYTLKRYPSLVKLTLVALQIANQYPFMKNTVENGHDHIVN
jgi:hypothetical protein